MYNKNVKIYPYYRLFLSLLILGPILVPFMLMKGLNYSQILLLQAISAIAVIIFEVPTGAIADKISRKLSLVLGTLFCSGGLLIYITCASFFAFTIAEIMFGIGMTLSSGADSAILYESLVKIDKRKEYQKIEGHAASLVFIGQAIGSIVSSLIYTINPILPFVVSIVNLIIAMFISLGFSETDRQKSEHHYLIHVVKSISIAVKTPRILWAVLFAAFTMFAMRCSFWLYQPYFKMVDINVIWFGAIFFVFNMVAAFSSKYLVKKFYDTRPRKVLLWLSSILAVSFLIPALFRSIFSIVFFNLQQIVRGLYQPTMKFYINHQIDDKYRATVISLVSLAGSVGFALLSPSVGVFLDKIGAGRTYLYMGLFVTGSTTFMYLLRGLQKKRKKRKE